MPIQTQRLKDGQYQIERRVPVFDYKTRGLSARLSACDDNRRIRSGS